MVEEMEQTHNTSLQNTSEHNFPDLISDLPDSLLLHILSLLDMVEVMKTTWLSRRWRNLWKYIPCLSFVDYSLPISFKFIDFISKCLLHREGSKIHKLHITFMSNEEFDPIAPLADSWIHFAMKCKVENFELDLYAGDNFDDGDQYDKLYRLPHSLYLCTKLTTLNIRGCNLNLPDSFQLGSLKKLSLELLELYSDSIPRLCSSCPMLEEIYLIDCNRGSDLTNIIITNEHVKRLEISYWYGQYGFGTVVINAPTLLFLGICNCHPTVRFHVEVPGSLMSVDLIDELILPGCYYDLNLQQSRNCLEELLYDLRHVKHLKLCCMYLQALSFMKFKSSDILSISATCLELTVSLKKWELPGISYLLQSCSNLQKLKIVNINYCQHIQLSDEFIDKHDFEEGQYWESFETDVPSVMENIKTIVIDLTGKIRHEEFVRFLLRNAKVLETIVINTPKGYEKYNFEIEKYNFELFKFSQRLNAFPRSSPNAKLFIT